VREDLAQCNPQTVKLGAGDAVGTPPRANAGMEETFVGVDIAHTGEKRLVQQSCLDVQTAAAEKCGELVRTDGQRFVARRTECSAATEVAELKPAKSPRIDETQFPAAFEREPRMRVRSNRTLWRGYQEPTGHTEVNDPLSTRPELFALVCVGDGAGRAQFEYDVFAGAMDREDGAAGKSTCLSRTWCLEGLRMTVKPDLNDAIAFDAFVDAAGDRLYLGQFRHRLIVEDRVSRFALRDSGGFLSGTLDQI